MPFYTYKAKTENGEVKSGKLRAAGEADLQQWLKERDLYLDTYKVMKEGGKKQLKSPVLADFNRQLGALIGAGVTLARALTIIANEEGLKPDLRDLYLELLGSVRRGESLSKAMEDQGKTFPTLMINMYRSAEAGSTMERTAIKMADHYEKDNKLQTKVKSAFMYPKILAVMIVLVLTIILTFVIPKFEELFANMPVLPLATRIILGLSDAVSTYWWLIIIIAIMVVTIAKIILSMPAVKLKVDKLKVHLPIVGKLMKTIYTARFARTLSSLYSCGIPIVNALQIAKRVTGNTYIESQFDEVVAFIRSGNPLSEGVLKIDGFVYKLSASVRVGEETGNLSGLLENMADNFDYESQAALERLVGLLEPVMIVIMALIILFIVVAVILPIYDSLAYIK